MNAGMTAVRWYRQNPKRGYWIDTDAATLALRVLWALALEIDERMATRTGEQVCRACGGRGEVWEWGRSDLAGNVDQDGAPPPQIYIGTP